jgi:hypothetical protein
MQQDPAAKRGYTIRKPSNPRKPEHPDESDVWAPTARQKEWVPYEAMQYSTGGKRARRVIVSAMHHGQTLVAAELAEEDTKFANLRAEIQKLQTARGQALEGSADSDNNVCERLQSALLQAAETQSKKQKYAVSLQAAIDLLKKQDFGQGLRQLEEGRYWNEVRQPATSFGLRCACVLPTKGAEVDFFGSDVIHMDWLSCRRFAFAESPTAKCEHLMDGHGLGGRGLWTV